MPRNIEVKLQVADLGALHAAARALGATGPTLLAQDDTFYAVPQGRLKLRRFADGSGELIHYHRPDLPGQRASDYVRAEVATPAALHDALVRAFGDGIVKGRVRKQRWLYLLGATRIHLDRVQDLGDFLELEVVLLPQASDAWGEAEANRLLGALGVAGLPRIAGAYLDLLPA